MAASTPRRKYSLDSRSKTQQNYLSPWAVTESPLSSKSPDKAPDTVRSRSCDACAKVKNPKDRGQPEVRKRSSLTNVHYQPKYSVHDYVSRDVNNGTDVAVTMETIQLLLRKERLNKAMNSYAKPQRRWSSARALSEEATSTSLSGSLPYLSHTRTNSLPTHLHRVGLGQSELLPVLEDRGRSRAGK